MLPPQSLPWMEPLELAASLMRDAAQTHWVLLYSGAQASYSGRYSYLAYSLRTQHTEFTAFADATSSSQGPFDNAWFGYLGYGLKNSFERLATDAPNWLELPDCCMMQFHNILVFDHQQRTVLHRTSGEEACVPTPTALPVYPITVHALASNMRKSDYLAKVADILRHIDNGDLYQANLTRKFTGIFAAPTEPFAVFCRLCRVSPAPYSAFLRLGDTSIASSSPELFLKIDADGYMRTRPIKGTAPRYEDNTQDMQSRRALEQSAKDQAENLMIVDLMRNDLSRACIPGSVQTPALFEVTSHATIHHMSSTITGRKRADCNAAQAVAQCFPPGSMTGAPKITAMNLCSELEREARGIYSGAIGWFGSDGSAELSVVIRTLIMRANRFEFQVGGGIVADSDPGLEFQETLVKAKGILATLGLDAQAIANL